MTSDTPKSTSTSPAEREELARLVEPEGPAAGLSEWGIAMCAADNILAAGYRRTPADDSAVVQALRELDRALWQETRHAWVQGVNWEAVCGLMRGHILAAKSVLAAHDPARSAGEER